MYSPVESHHESVANALLNSNGKEIPIRIEGDPIAQNYCVILVPHDGIIDPKLMHQLTLHDIPYITYTEIESGSSNKSSFLMRQMQLIEVIRFAQTMAKKVCLEMHADDLPLFTTITDFWLPILRNVQEIVPYSYIAGEDGIQVGKTIELKEVTIPTQG